MWGGGSFDEKSPDGSRSDAPAVQKFMLDPAMMPSPGIGGIFFIFRPDVMTVAR